ncbi:acyltransferase [Ornithinimicrobium sp. LYQ121]|uniref:acyltransferase n=1 Tax=Ornithinimicrobium sp. LYQ121 TaxID=3378801 RepID=UPI00385323D8
MGNHVTVSSEVQFITHDGGVWVFRAGEPDLDVVAPIVVHDNVFIGSRVTILPGVTIGAHSVIGAGSVVTKDVPTGVVVAGCPARVRSTIDAYKARCIANGVRTKGLAPEAKREVLLAMFASQLEQ